MSDQVGDKVNFISIPGAYKTGENVLVMYEVCINFETKSRDWIGLFRVGWSSNRDYYTFEWAQSSSSISSREGTDVRQLKFSGSRLPPEDGHFYQFCYVNSAGIVKGASRPFQFTKTISGDFIGDLDDIVEVKEDESILLLRSRHEMQLAELQKKVENLTAANDDTGISLEAVKAELENLKVKHAHLLAQLEASQLEVANLKATVEAKEEQTQKIKAKLEESEEQFEASQKEVGLLQATVVAKEEEAVLFKQHISELRKKIENMEEHLADLEKLKSNLEKHTQGVSDEMIIMVDENKRLQDNEQALRGKCTQLEQENRELMENKEVIESRLVYRESEIVKLNTDMAALRENVRALEEEMNEMASELEKERDEKAKLVKSAEIKEQELNIVQSNLCEVLGNVKEPRDMLGHSTSIENVDKSALEALQFAYSDVEKRWNIERKSALRLKNKVAELEARIEQCRVEFETLFTENAALKKEVKRCRTPSLSEKSVGNSEGAVVLLQKEYERLELELQEFQQKHDQRMDEKNTRINQLEKLVNDANKELDGRRDQEAAMKKTLESLKMKNDQLNASNVELNQRLEDLQRSRRNHPKEMLITPAPYNPNYQPVVNRPPTRYVPPPTGGVRHPKTPKQCPVCNAQFPHSMEQKDFENHVQHHFPA